MHLGNARTALLAWLDVRARGGSHAAADRGPRPRPLPPGVRGRAPPRPRVAGPRLGRRGARPVDARGGVRRRDRRAAGGRPDLRVLLHASRAARGLGAARRVRRDAALRRGLPRPGRGGPAVAPRRGAAARRCGSSRRPRTRRWSTASPARSPRAPASEVVVRRSDGLYAYHLAVVVDDAADGVTDVCRGDDLLPATGPQAGLQALLGLPRPAYAHVPLVLGPDGARLSKRHGAVAIADLRDAGIRPGEICGALARSAGACRAGRGHACAAGRELRPGADRAATDDAAGAGARRLEDRAAQERRWLLRSAQRTARRLTPRRRASELRRPPSRTRARRRGRRRATR